MTLTTGILSLARSDDEIATIIGHELAHVVALHAREELMFRKIERSLLLPWLPPILAGSLMVTVGAFVGEEVIWIPGLVLASPALAVFLWTLRTQRIK